MNLSDAPFAEKKFMTVNGQRMAYIDEGKGDAIVFSHGNPTSSYLWRNITPACRGLGRLIACDLIGQGDSDTRRALQHRRGVRSQHRPDPSGQPDSTLDADAIAQTYIDVLAQPRNAWSHEIDLRPWTERF